MNITFIGDPRGRDPHFISRHRAFKADDPPFIELYDMRFPLNQTVHVPDDSQWAKDHRAKIEGNSHFEVADGAPAELTAQAVSSVEPDRSQLDHDGDGEPGGSLPAEDRGEDLAKLRARAEELDVKVDMRWGANRLNSEINKALNG